MHVPMEQLIQNCCEFAFTFFQMCTNMISLFKFEDVKIAKKIAIIDVHMGVFHLKIDHFVKYI